jgi:hypothetical protein
LTKLRQTFLEKNGKTVYNRIKDVKFLIKFRRGIIMKNVVIASAVRTPIGKYGGTLKDVPAAELGSIVIKEALNRAGIKPEQVDEFIMDTFYKQTRTEHGKASNGKSGRSCRKYQHLL